jgi:DNA repair protein RecN (Recombination protein N)
MLTHFSIRDYVLVDKLDVEFHKGLNIITGETGAGKSIIVDALSLLLGERAKTDIIRTGREKAVIQGIFTLEKNGVLTAIIRDFGIDVEDDEIIIRREISEGKNRCLINGLPFPLQTLKKLGECLVDVHGQNEQQSLFNINTHLTYLDAYANTEKELREYGTIHAVYVEKRDGLAALIKKETVLKEKKDFLLHQEKELSNAALKEGGEKELLARLHYLESGQKTKDLLNEIFSILEDDFSTRFSRAKKLFEKLACMDASFNDKIKCLDEIRVLHGELLSGLPAGAEIDADAEWNVDDLNEKLAVISKLKRKYSRDESGLIALRDEAEKELAFLENTETGKEELKKEINKLEDLLREKAESLSQARKKAAKKFDKNILLLLEQMNMGTAVFTSLLSKKESFAADGLDAVEFLVSANPGEPARPLTKIASGGEISRIMLAIKTVLANNDHIPILIFDEVDTGIGGETAGKIGALLKSLSKYHQLFCVTHSHQIAKEADNHFSISKIITADRTSVSLRHLDSDDRVDEIARMLGGSNLKITRSHAESLVRRSA